MVPFKAYLIPPVLFMAFALLGLMFFLSALILIVRINSPCLSCAAWTSLISQLIRNPSIFGKPNSVLLTASDTTSSSQLSLLCI